MTGQEHENDHGDDPGASRADGPEPGQEPKLDPVRAKLKAQLELVIGDGQGRPGIPGATVYPPDWLERGYFDYIYRADTLLCRDQDAEAVRAKVDGVIHRRGGTGHVAFTADPARDDDDHETGADDPVARGRAGAGTRGLSLVEIRDHSRSLVDWVQVMDDELGVGVATPDHLLYLTSAVSHCPATEPEPVRAHHRPVPAPLAPAPPAPDPARDVSVFILDSGWFKDAGLQHEWLAGVRGRKEHTYVGGTAQIQNYSGHGTFCAGVLRAVAPRTDVYVARTFYLNGGVFESDIAPQVVQAVSAGADILSLSAGTHTRNDLPMLGFEIVRETIKSYKAVVLVCAAGNDSSRQPFFPAALDWTVSVGALGTDWQERAWFTNYGGWVDCYAPGEDLINAFPTGWYECIEPPNAGQVRHFGGMARWSGTSFSTPLVAGLIADRMSRTGENGQQAARSVLRRARENFRPGVGPVLLPGHDEAYEHGPGPEHHRHHDGHHDGHHRRH